MCVESRALAFSPQPRAEHQPAGRRRINKHEKELLDSRRRTGQKRLGGRKEVPLVGSHGCRFDPSLSMHATQRRLSVTSQPLAAGHRSVLTLSSLCSGEEEDGSKTVVAWFFLPCYCPLRRRCPVAVHLEGECPRLPQPSKPQGRHRSRRAVLAHARD